MAEHISWIHYYATIKIEERGGIGMRYDGK